MGGARGVLVGMGGRGRGAHEAAVLGLTRMAPGAGSGGGGDGGGDLSPGVAYGTSPRGSSKITWIGAGASLLKMRSAFVVAALWMSPTARQ